MPGEGAHPYSRVRGANGEMYEIWVLRFTPAFFRPFLKNWRLMLPSLRWRVIVALAGGSRHRLISRVVDARVFNTEDEATAGIDRIKSRISAGRRPWSDAEKDELVIPAIGSDAARPTKRRRPARPRPGVFVLRPRNGIPSFRRNAGFRLEDGVITATDRRGRARSFPFDGTDAAPREFRLMGSVDGLVDGTGNMLTRSYGVDWGAKEFVDFLVAANLRMVYADPALPVPPLRPDGIEISTFDPLPTMKVTTAIGFLAWRTSYFDLLPGVVPRTVIIASVLGFVGSFAFSIITDADAEPREERPAGSPESRVRRQRRKARKRRLRRRASGGQ